MIAFAIDIFFAIEPDRIHFLHSDSFDLAWLYPTKLIRLN